MLPVDANEMAALRTQRSVRPQGGRKEGPATWLPEAMVKDLLTLPARAGQVAVDYGQTGAYNPAPIMESALTAMTGGMPLAKSGAAGIFGGRLAQTADRAALAKAEQMAANGAFPDDIYTATGWFQGRDKKWRFEIPDQAAKVNPDGIISQSRFEIADQYLKDSGISHYIGSPKIPPGIQEEALHYADQVIGQKTVPMAGYMHHADLYAAYPELRNVKVGREGNLQFGGSYDPSNNTIRVGGGIVGKTDPRSTMLHEAQHKVQEIEGFAGGANHMEFTQQKEAQLARDALSFRRELNAMPKGMDAHAKENAVIQKYQELGAMDWLPSREARDLAHDRVTNPDGQLRKLMMFYGLDQRTTPYTSQQLYKRHAGEVEARNVQSRADWTNERRSEIPPWYSQDTLDADQIVRLARQPNKLMGPR